LAIDFSSLEDPDFSISASSFGKEYADESINENNAKEYPTSSREQGLLDLHEQQEEIIESTRVLHQDRHPQDSN